MDDAVPTVEEVKTRMQNLVDAKQDFVIDFLRLGMDWKTALIAAELTDEQGDELLANDEFRARLNYCLAQKEAQLLRRLEQASEKAVEKGDSKVIERQLAILRPDKYGAKASLQLSMPATNDDSNEGIVVSFKKPEQAVDKE